MWSCKVYHEEHNITLFECQRKTLKMIAEDLGLTYQQVADMTANSRNKKEYQKFKFYPKIEIVRIKKTSDVNNNEC